MVFDKTYSAGFTHPLAVLTKLFLASKYPQQPPFQSGGNLRLRCVPVRKNDQAVVFAVFGHIIHDRLEIGPAAPLDLEFGHCPREGDGLTRGCVKSEGIDLLHAVFEKAVNGGKEKLQVVVRDGSAHVDRYQVVGP